MFFRRFCSISPKNNQFRRFCQTSIEKIEKTEKRKVMWLEAKRLYIETIPMVIAVTMWASLFSVNPEKDDSCYFFEHVIYSITLGSILGATYPVSFPIIAFNVWRKKNKRGEKGF